MHAQTSAQGAFESAGAGSADLVRWTALTIGQKSQEEGSEEEQEDWPQETNSAVFINTQ